MSDLRPPRFPYVAALVCAACLGGAAFLFFLYSYAWGVTPGQLLDAEGGCLGAILPVHAERWMDERWAEMGRDTDRSPPYEQECYPRSAWLGRYVRVRGQRAEAAAWPVPASVMVLSGSGSPPDSVDVYLGDTGGVHEQLARARSGRVVIRACKSGSLSWIASLTVDTTRSRWTGESIAGLIVGAMGVFVFTVALRHWLRERRAGA